MSRHRIREAPKPSAADKTRAAFYQLTLDWIHLRNNLPKPRHTTPTRRTTTREYGHPAEWASDKSAEIAEILWSWHDNLAEHRNETPPPPAATAEITRVTKAWKYLEPRFDYLIELVDPEALTEISRLHNTIRHVLGKSNPKMILPFPCPNPDCALKTLQRDIRVGVYGLIICGSCAYTTREENYQFMLRVILDTLIDAA